MGAKAATNEMIDRLLILLGDINWDVRRSACAALGKRGEKAATNEVINRLLILLGDAELDVRRSAWEALGKMGEKATTDEVIGVLLGVYEHCNVGMSFDVCIILGRILDLKPSLSDLKSDTVRKMSQCILECDLRFQISFSAEKLIKGFLETSISFWLPIIKVVFSRKGYSLTVNGMAITVESNKELVELRAENMELGQQLQQYLINWLDRSLENGE